MKMKPIFFIPLTFLCFYYTSVSANPIYHYCSQVTSNQATLRNINTLLPTLVSGTIRNGFIATSYGIGKDHIYGLAQCRGDVGKFECTRCIRDAVAHIHKQCPTQAEVRVWYDYCFLKYENMFFGDVDTGGAYLQNVESVSVPDGFNKKLLALMDQIRSEAVGPGRKRIGKGKSDISSIDRLYALVQCTRDLSELKCDQCVSLVITNFPTFCNNKKGCRVMLGSCYVRYEMYPFFYPLDSEESLSRSSVEYALMVAGKP